MCGATNVYLNQLCRTQHQSCRDHGEAFSLFFKWNKNKANSRSKVLDGNRFMLNFLLMARDQRQNLIPLP